MKQKEESSIGMEEKVTASRRDDRSNAGSESNSDDMIHNYAKTQDQPIFQLINNTIQMTSKQEENRSNDGIKPELIGYIMQQVGDQTLIPNANANQNLYIHSPLKAIPVNNNNNDKFDDSSLDDKLAKQSGKEKKGSNNTNGFFHHSKSANDSQNPNQNTFVHAIVHKSQKNVSEDDESSSHDDQNQKEGKGRKRICSIQ